MADLPCGLSPILLDVLLLLEDILPALLGPLVRSLGCIVPVRLQMAINIVVAQIEISSHCVGVVSDKSKNK